MHVAIHARHEAIASGHLRGLATQQQVRQHAMLSACSGNSCCVRTLLATTCHLQHITRNEHGANSLSATR